MYIRAIKKQRSKDSKVFYQYSLSQSARVDGKVKQRSILYLGSNPLLADKENRAVVLSILKAKIFKIQSLFPEIDVPKELEELALSLYEKYCIKYGETDVKDGPSIPPAPERAEFHNIDIKAMESADIRTFGAEHLSKQILDKLELRECFISLGMSEKQTRKALLSIAARAIFTSSEYKTARLLKDSELQQCFGIKQEVTYKQLYAVADMLYKHREKIDEFLYKRITNLFSLEDKLVIFDISNTYFDSNTYFETIVPKKQILR